MRDTLEVRLPAFKAKGRGPYAKIITDKRIGEEEVSV
jgi:hypothetical protein